MFPYSFVRIVWQKMYSRAYSTSFVQSISDPGYEEDFWLPSSNNYIHENSKPLDIST